MKVCVIGTGYVGLVTGTCLAEMGNSVYCIDNNIKKIDSLQNGIVPFFEPRLHELVVSNQIEKRLYFSTDIKKGIEESDIIFISVSTPTSLDGKADLSFVLDVVDEISTHMNSYKLVVSKSTVPIGTNEKIKKLIYTKLVQRKLDLDFDVVSNPEFLKEGAAVEDFMRPDRIIIGVENERAQKLMLNLYEPFIKNGHPIKIMDIKSAEITKYAANCMLASRISFMNLISELCEKAGADILKVREGVGTDNRIGMPFLYAGLGYGGSCFPKDIRALKSTLDEYDIESNYLSSIENINNRQRSNFITKIENKFAGGIKNKILTIWGLSFKPNTDDMREAPSITVINHLVNEGAIVQVFDPQASKVARTVFATNSNIVYFDNQYEALIGSEALIVITEWNSFKNPDFSKMHENMTNYYIFDGRNIYNSQQMKELGFKYFGIGR